MGTKIDDVVSKEALQQIDSLIEKLNKAIELQKELNKEIERGNYLKGTIETTLTQD